VYKCGKTHFVLINQDFSIHISVDKYFFDGDNGIYKKGGKEFSPFPPYIIIVFFYFSILKR